MSLASESPLCLRLALMLIHGPRSPTPLPTPLGIHRLYTTPSYRSHSLSSRLLDAACEHTVYGCTFDPRRGEIAFSQPTESGRGVMERWGGGEVRVFVDDESQL